MRHNIRLSCEGENTDIKRDLSCLTDRERIGFLNECRTDLVLKALPIKYKSNPLDSPKKWKKKVEAGADFIGKGWLMEDKRWEKQYRAKRGIWECYPVTPAMFKSEMLDRFIKSDPYHLKKWMLKVLRITWDGNVWALIREHRITVIQSDCSNSILTARLKSVLGVRGGYLRTPTASTNYEKYHVVDLIDPPDYDKIPEEVLLNDKGPPYLDENPALNDCSISVSCLKNEEEW